MFATGLNKLISDRVKFVDMNFNMKSFNNMNSLGAIESQSNLFFFGGAGDCHILDIGPLDVGHWS